MRLSEKSTMQYAAQRPSPISAVRYDALLRLLRRTIASITPAIQAMRTLAGTMRCCTAHATSPVVTSVPHGQTNHESRVSGEQRKQVVPMISHIHGSMMK